LAEVEPFNNDTMAKKVIAIIDIGKTNKKIFLFDQNFEVVYRNSKRFEERKDDDGFPCDDIHVIEHWIKEEIQQIQQLGEFEIKALNFSTHGATLVYLDKKGERVTPVYNYLKPISTEVFEHIYKKNKGVVEFSRITASPSYGMLNAGVQIIWLKTKKPHLWKKVNDILHYPQYFSFLFTSKITTDYTSIGAHTALWNYDKMEYHEWLCEESINLPEPTDGKSAVLTEINGQQIYVGKGMHDSSSSIIPLLEREEGDKFILLSTGTWIIAMNPFSKEVLSKYQLENNCLCFMTPDKRQIKSSMQFLGRIHEVYLEAMGAFFNCPTNTHLELELNKKLCSTLVSQKKRVFLQKGIDTHFEADTKKLIEFLTYEESYYQLVFEISRKVVSGIQMILDKNAEINKIFISGGFTKNEIFIYFLELLLPEIKIMISEAKNESALGAALMMKNYI
jgi:sugar (pentulose or hexulose) kinase